MRASHEARLRADIRVRTPHRSEGDLIGEPGFTYAKLPKLEAGDVLRVSDTLGDGPVGIEAFSNKTLKRYDKSLIRTDYYGTISVGSFAKESPIAKEVDREVLGEDFVVSKDNDLRPIGLSWPSELRYSEDVKYLHQKLFRALKLPNFSAETTTEEGLKEYLRLGQKRNPCEACEGPVGKSTTHAEGCKHYVPFGAYTRAGSVRGYAAVSVEEMPTWQAEMEEFWNEFKILNVYGSDNGFCVTWEAAGFKKDKTTA